MHGSTPYVIKGYPTDQRALFYSNENAALVIPVTIPAGYGVLQAGVVLGQITESTSRKGQWVPYAKERPEIGVVTAAVAYLVQDGAASTLVAVKMDDAYKFAVGDHLCAADNTNYNAAGTGATDLGAITAIDVTTYPHLARITVTNNVTTAHTVALGSCVWIQTATAAPFTAAKAILTTSVDTGIGSLSKGALGGSVISNAILYVGALLNYDAEVLADLGGVESGNFLVLK